MTEAFGIGAYFHFLFGQDRCDFLKKGSRGFTVHKHSLDGVAHTWTLCLCVNDDSHSHIQIGFPVHICDAQPQVVFDHRHPRMTHDCFDQATAATWDDKIDALVHLSHVPHGIPTSAWNEQNTVFRQSHPGCASTERFRNRGVGANRFRAPAQNDCVSRFCAKHRSIAGHIRA